MPASWRVFIHAAKHCSSVPYSRSNAASVSPCMIARIGPIPLLVGGDSALIPSTVVEGVDWLISGYPEGRFRIDHDDPGYRLDPIRPPATMPAMSSGIRRGLR